MNVSSSLEIKEEVTEHLINILTPFLYEGINSIYKEAEKMAIEGKTLIIFQKLLQLVGKWDQTAIDKETDHIKQASGMATYLDALTKAVIKSNIAVLLPSVTIERSYYNSVTASSLIHKCYIECAKDAHNDPHLFLQYNVISEEIRQNIRHGITRSIIKMLPISYILDRYIQNNVTETQNIEIYI